MKKQLLGPGGVDKMGRKYDVEDLVKQIESKINKGTLYGEACPSNGGALIDVERVAVITDSVEVKPDGSVEIELRTTNTPMGQVVEPIFETLHTSLRCLGSIDLKTKEVSDLQFVAIDIGM